MTQSADPTIITNADGSTIQVGITCTYTPAPVVEPTKWGYTARTGESMVAFQATDAIYGFPQSVAEIIGRFYCNGVLTAPPTTDRDWIGSFKTYNTADLPKIKQLAALFAELFLDHEIDHQIIAGATTLAAWKGNMQAMLDYGVPNLGICLTADCFVNPKKNPLDYMIDGITNIAVDFDGVPPSASGYHDYGKEYAAVMAFVAKYGYVWSSVPEWNTAQGAFDPDDSLRAAWQRTGAGRFRAAKVKRVCWWEGASVPKSFCDLPATRQTLTTLLRFA